MPRRRKDIVHLLEQTTAQRIPVLDLSNCNLGELLDGVCQMGWLVELNLSHCHIRALPETIGNLTGLTRLLLVENQLTALPDSIIRLTGLRHLDLRSAGLEVGVSETVKAWLKTLPEVIWTDGKPPNFDPPPPLVFREGPNDILGWLKSALKLYTDALSMEDRGFGGSGKRAEADAFIERIFQIPEMPGLLPEFFQDLQEHRFYSTSCESEKSLDENPFRLPTKADADWLATNLAARQPPLNLDSCDEGGRRILTVNRQTGAKTEVVVCQQGGITQSNAPYAQDEYYWADCAAWLYQAGSERFYVRVETYGPDDLPGGQWFSSSDGGVSWQKQARLTYDWLNKSCDDWRELDHCKSTGSQEK